MICLDDDLRIIGALSMVVLIGIPAGVGGVPGVISDHIDTSTVDNRRRCRKDHYVNYVD